MLVIGMLVQQMTEITSGMFSIYDMKRDFELHIASPLRSRPACLTNPWVNAIGFVIIAK